MILSGDDLNNDGCLISLVGYKTIRQLYMKSSAVLTAEPAQAVALDLPLTIDCFADAPVVLLQ